MLGIHEVLPGDGRPWIIMEYVPARSLLQLIRDGGALHAVQAAHIGLAVLQALNAAHRMAVLHTQGREHLRTAARPATPPTAATATPQ